MDTPEANCTFRSFVMALPPEVMKRLPRWEYALRPLVAETGRPVAPDWLKEEFIQQAKDDGVPMDGIENGIEVAGWLAAKWVVIHNR